MNLVQQTAPDFTADAVYPDGSIGKFKLTDCRKSYVVLFFYPMDFTFVCPTEIIAFDAKAAEFEKRGVILAAVSTDSAYSHLAWRGTPRKSGGLGMIHFPLVSDYDKSISRAYGVLAGGAFALRGLFLIDRDGIVRHQLINDAPLGRSVEEALRMVDALQFYEKHGEVCPANWHSGDAGIVPSKEGVSRYLAEHAE